MSSEFICHLMQSYGQIKPSYLKVGQKQNQNLIRNSQAMPYRIVMEIHRQGIPKYGQDMQSYDIIFAYMTMGRYDHFL